MTAPAGTPSAVLEAAGVTLKRGRNTLLRELSWRVERGQHWAVLGPNGAGKTMLMRVLTGYLWPTAGTVDILGRRLGTVDLRVLRRSIGWVAKALEELTPADATVLEVILSGPEASLGLYVRPPAHRVDEAEALAEEYGLGRLAGREFGLLSSGEKQRALLARAVLSRPALLFLDEPMANLDMGGREQFMALLERLAGGPSAPAIVLTTHNTLEIGPYMTHALLMKNGAVLAAGPLAETMEPEPLGAAFDLPLKVERTPSGRYLAYL
ncbi:ATP-binding cassette domain-containing protein [Deltaproteobacteria bacterium OttesenSCG-928-M10]|nr:ATP-binding cassette domain-containing protein [Deltaproteobacteria bacterium OttesenSCG-928-M10]